ENSLCHPFPYCRKMESFLKKNGIQYRRYNIDADRAANRRYQSMGGGGIPLTKVGDYVIRGYDPGAVLRALR
ncbi:MAG: glutaredoxin family protein, partial [Candidatus Omnitrophica bacterium]|nr:glutaredoxin family protein [Candidatus Omnitrophota bacterium]